jgi:hypothetical protein
MLLHIALFDRSSEGNFMVVTLISSHHQSRNDIVMQQFRNNRKAIVLFLSFFFRNSTCHIEITLICIKFKKNKAILSHMYVYGSFNFEQLLGPPTDHLQNLIFRKVLLEYMRLAQRVLPKESRTGHVHWAFQLDGK